MMRRNLILSITMFALTAAPGRAQGPVAREFVGCGDPCTSASHSSADGVMAAHGPVGQWWARAGVQVGYVIASRGKVDDLSDYFAPRVELGHSPDDTKQKLQWHAYGNLGKLDASDPANTLSKLNALVNSAAGAQVLFEPYYEEIDGARSFVVYGAAGVKVNRIKEIADTSKTSYATQYRTLVGVDGIWHLTGENDRPFTFSLVGNYGYLGAEKMKALTGGTDDYLMSLEATMVAPLPNVTDWGLLAQGIVMKNGTPVWRLGTLVFNPQKKQADDSQKGAARATK